MAELLPGPFELLEIAHAQTVELLIVRKELGDLIIHPRTPGAPSEKIIRGMRVWVDVASKRVGPPYWDVTSGTLIVQLLPLLEGVPPATKRVRITATGVAPAKRFTVELVP